MPWLLLRSRNLALETPLHNCVLVSMWATFDLDSHASAVCSIVSQLCFCTMGIPVWICSQEHNVTELTRSSETPGHCLGSSRMLWNPQGFLGRTQPDESWERAAWHRAGCRLFGCTPTVPGCFPWEKFGWGMCRVWVFSNWDFQLISLMTPFVVLILILYLKRCCPDRQHMSAIKELLLPWSFKQIEQPGEGWEHGSQYAVLYSPSHLGG